MEIEEAIYGRRSVRTYTAEPVPIELVRKVVEAGTYAPSAKNGQQWRFTVLTGDSKVRLLSAFRKGLKDTEARIDASSMGSSWNSLAIMERAPVVVIVWNAGRMGWESEAHSVSAAVQNMLLMAYALGLGSLWIADVFYAPESIRRHLGKEWKLIAAVALGWPEEGERNKVPPKKMGVDKVTEFLG